MDKLGLQQISNTKLDSEEYIKEKKAKPARKIRNKKKKSYSLMYLPPPYF